MRCLLTAPQVAAKLGHTATWFARNQATLEAEHGFPRPVDGCGLRWDPVAIDDWFDARHRPGTGPNSAAEQTLITRARTIAAA